MNSEGHLDYRGSSYIYIENIKSNKVIGTIKYDQCDTGKIKGKLKKGNILKLKEYSLKSPCEGPMFSTHKVYLDESGVLKSKGSIIPASQHMT